MIPKSKSNSKSLAFSFEALIAAFPSMAGSLWRKDAAGESGLLADRRARQRRARREYPAE